MRVYVPVTFVGLGRAQSSGALATSGWKARVSPPVTADQDEEAGEYAALLAAAADSLEELKREPEAPRRRAVVVANVPDEWTEMEPGGGVVLTRRIPVERFLAVYADAPESATAVVAALNGKASPIEDLDLLWFARQELPELVG